MAQGARVYPPCCAQGPPPGCGHLVSRVWWLGAGDGLHGD